ncbi:MAG: ribosome maturation factor RimP [Pelosinus sp.]|nr:ribosome maturation factor RimP [Pelosinus sp.]
MAREQIEELVEKLANDIIAETALELVDVEYIKEREWYLRVFLDKEGGMDIEDCQWVSERLEAKLDELDPISDSYYLEVSSPGLDRPLKKERDFVRHAGDKVELHTFAPLDGKKDFVGVLKGLVDNEIQVDIDGNELSIPREKVAQIRLYLEF